MHRDDDSDSEVNGRLQSLLMRSEQVLRGRDAPARCPDDSSSTIMELQAHVATLTRKLEEKDALCRRLETMIERLLATRHECSSATVDSTRRVVHEDLTQEYFMNEFKSTHSQLWFERNVPPAVEGVFEKLASKLPDMYGDRRKALTMKECFNMVDEVRGEWERDIPLLIRKSLAVNNQVYPSKSCAREGIKGRRCEPVHFLIYIVYKLFNRAAQVLIQVRKALDNSAGINLENTGVNFDTVPNRDEDVAPGKERWRDNPSFNVVIGKARTSVQAFAFDNQAALIDAMNASIGKLIAANKPKLEDSLSYLASIIAMKELAATRGWEIDSTRFLHREIFQYKMLEYWQLTGYLGTLDAYRMDVFNGINSMVMYLYMCGGKDVVSDLMKYLRELTKGHSLKDLDIALQALMEAEDPEPLWNVLRTFSSTAEFGAFYAKAFVALLQFVAVHKCTNMHETVLLNLVHDLKICNISKLSVLEKHDYIKVISIIATVTLQGKGRNAVRTGDTGRDKYYSAAIYIVKKLEMLLKVDKLEATDEMKFWTEPVIEEYVGLEEYCPDMNRWRHVFPRVRLPKWNQQGLASRATELGATVLGNNLGLKGSRELEPVADGTPSGTLLHLKEQIERTPSKRLRDSKETTESLSAKVIKEGAKVADLRDLLRAAGLSTTGKKGELKKRLLEAGGFEAASSKNCKRQRGPTETAALAEDDGGDESDWD